MQTTEIKSLINMLNNTEYGLSRVNLLKSLWNEEISFARKGDVQNIKIPESKLAIVSSGVPADILAFLGNDGVGSGLLSRMIFFALVTKKRVWRTWSVTDDEPSNEVLEEERAQAELIYEALQRRQEPLRVRFTQEQFDRINELYQPRFEEGEVVARLEARDYQLVVYPRRGSDIDRTTLPPTVQVIEEGMERLDVAGVDDLFKTALPCGLDILEGIQQGVAQAVGHRLVVVADEQCQFTVLAEGVLRRQTGLHPVLHRVPPQVDVVTQECLDLLRRGVLLLPRHLVFLFPS